MGVLVSFVLLLGFAGGLLLLLAVWFASEHFGTDRVWCSRQISRDYGFLIRPMRTACRLSRICVLVAMATGALAGSAEAQTAHFSGAESTMGSGFSLPSGLIVDGSGNVYIADTGNNRVVKETLSSGVYVQSTLPTKLNISSPSGLGIDANGNIYISDTNNNRVLKETPAGGSYTESIVDSTNLSGPRQIAADASGNVYIADYGHNQIVKETPAGSAYTASQFPTSTPLNKCSGIAIDANGNIYISDSGNQRVLKETLAGGSYTESTVATSAVVNQPKRLTVDASGNVFIADGGRGSVIKETPSGSGYSAATVATTNLTTPFGVAVDASGTLYIADQGANLVFKLQMSGGDFGTVVVGGTVSTRSLLFTFDTAGSLGSAPTVSTQGIGGFEFTAASSGTCSTSSPYSAGAVCWVNVTFAPKISGLQYGAAVLKNSANTGVIATGYVQGTGSGPQVNFAPGIETAVASNSSALFTSATSDRQGGLYVSDANNNLVQKWTYSGGSYTATTIASGTLSGPRQIAVDGSGNVYIADFKNNRIAKEAFAGGSYTETTLNTISLISPVGVAVDGAGNVYIVDYGNNRIVLETPVGSGYNETVLAISGLNGPNRIAVDASGNLYIADSGNNRIVQEIVSGGVYTQGAVFSSFQGKSFANPRGVAVDAFGNIYIVDSNNSRVVEEVFTGGGFTARAVATGSTLNNPYSVGIDGSGNVYIADYGNTRVLKEDMSDPPGITFPQTSVGATSSAQTLALQNIGNAPLTFPAPSSGNNPAISANFSVDGSVANACPQTSAGQAAGAPLASGSSCVLAVRFAPTAVTNYSGNLVISDTNLNASGALQSFSLTGSGTAAATGLVLAAPASATYGNAVQVTASVTNQATQGTVSGGSVAFSDQNGSFGSQSVQSGKAVRSYLASAIGAFTLTGAFTPPDNTLNASSGQTTIQITAAPLNVTANNASRTYGAANPSFAGAVTGAVNGDTFTESFATPATASSAVGSYAITPTASGTNIGNYTVTPTDGTLTVGPAALGVTANNASRTYGAANPSFAGAEGR